MRLIRYLEGVVKHRIPKAISSVVVEAPLISLTFDDGPSDATLVLLDILSFYDARATFFMVGRDAKERPDILRKVVEKGHAIGGHTESHRSLTCLSPQSQLTEIWHGLRPLPKTLLFRPPYGAQNVTSYLTTRAVGLHPVGWSRSADDWLGDNEDTLLNRISTNLRPGEIILLHDGLKSYQDERFADRTPTISAVERLLQSHRHNFSFVTVPELIQCGSPVWQRWYSTHS